MMKRDKSTKFRGRTRDVITLSRNYSEIEKKINKHKSWEKEKVHSGQVMMMKM